MDLGGEESGGPVRRAKPEPAASKACPDRGTRSAASEVRVAIKGVTQGVSQAETGSSPPTGSQPWQSPISPASPMTIFAPMPMDLAASTPPSATSVTSTAQSGKRRAKHEGRSGRQKREHAG